MVLEPFRCRGKTLSQRRNDLPPSQLLFATLLLLTASFTTLESTQIKLLGKDDTVKITLSGYSAADVQWRINGRSLEELGVDRYEVQPDGSLLIRDVRLSDAGRYSIYISSLNLPAGTPAEIINVDVKGIARLSPAC